MADKVPVTNNESANRFEARVGENTAILTYMRQPDALVLTHTEVPEELEGRGLGGDLVRTAMDYARTEGLRIVPRCPFVLTWLKRHPEYEDVVQKQ